MPPPIQQLAAQIRQIYTADPNTAPENVEALLAQQLRTMEAEERDQYLSQLKALFMPQSPDTASSALPSPPTMEGEIFERFCSLLLGPSASPNDVNNPETMARLSASLNTVFDMLNQLIQAINATLFDTGNPEATIRHVIGRQMADEGSGRSLEDYLGQIKTAFLTTQEAYKVAARVTVGRLLSELDPDTMAADDKGGFTFGRLRKGDYFDRYTQKYATCRKWFESPRFMEDFLREFEKNCHHLAQQQRR